MSKLLEYLERAQEQEVAMAASERDIVHRQFSEGRPYAAAFGERVRWIPVEVEPPPVPDEVYLVTDGERVQSAGWDPSYGGDLADKFFEPHDQCRLHWTPTHWALLPKPPRKT